MSKLHRFARRLRREALRWYEILLCAVLLALAVSMAAPAPEADGEAAAVQCGNIRSSTMVTQR